MKPRLIRISTVPMALRILLTGQPRYMREHGFDVLLLSADGKERNEVMALEGCEHIIVPMTRKITPWQDLRCLWQLRRIFKQYKPHIVHTHTPKAGLLGMLAAKWAGIPVRIHTVAGLPLMVEKGIKRKILMLTERLTYFGATQVWPNSPSMLRFIREQQLCPEHKLAMINNGSSNGVDTAQFDYQRWQQRSDNPALQTLPTATGKRLLCVGRMVADKGIEELIVAFRNLSAQHALQLVLVGPFETGLDPLLPETMQYIQQNPNIVHIPWSDAVEQYMAAADILVHPSHREGFPNVLLQAGAMQLPIVCSNIPGNTDIVRHGETGFVCHAQQAESLQATLQHALLHPAEAKQCALRLYDEIVHLYDRPKMHQAIRERYQQLLATAAADR